MILGGRINQKLWAEDPEYQRLLRQNFSLATLCRFSLDDPTNLLIDFSQELTREGFLVHAHRLFTKRDSRRSKLQSNSRKEATSKLRALTKKRVGELAHCYSLDIFNEIINSDGIFSRLPWIQGLEKDWLRIVLEEAKAIAPDLKIFWNEYALKNSDYWDTFYRLCVPLVEDGLLDGIGIQIHSRLDRWWSEGKTLLGPDYYPSFSRAKFYRQAERFKALGLSVRISECSVVSQPGKRSAKGKLYANYFDYASKAGAEAFILWHPIDGPPDVGGYQNRQESPGGNPGWWGWANEQHQLKDWARPLILSANGH